MRGSVIGTAGRGRAGGSRAGSPRLSAHDRSGEPGTGTPKDRYASVSRPRWSTGAGPRRRSPPRSGPRISYARPAANARRPKALRNHGGVAGEWGSDRLAGGQVPHLHRVVGAEDDHRASRSVASGRKVHSDGITASMDNPRRRGHPRIPPALASREHMDVPTRGEEPVMAGSIRKSLDSPEETRWLSC